MVDALIQPMDLYSFSNGWDNYTQPIILTVDDQPEDLEILNHILNREKYFTISARNGVEAYKLLLENNNIDVILLDRMMPEMDGIALINLMKHNPSLNHIPVIMQTGASLDNHICEGISAGAYYYITKPFSHQFLLSVLRAALIYSRHNRDMRNKISFYINNRKKLKNGFESLMNLLKDVAFAVACCYPDPNKVVGGITELLLNAHEHGNLGIHYKSKGELLLSGKWQSEILFREALPEYAAKKISVIIQKSAQEIILEIKDEGSGFDHQYYLEEKVEYSNINGRGISIARSEFSKIIYNYGGAKVSCIYNL